LLRYGRNEAERESKRKHDFNNTNQVIVQNGKPGQTTKLRTGTWISNKATSNNGRQTTTEAQRFKNTGKQANTWRLINKKNYKALKNMAQNRK